MTRRSGSTKKLYISPNQANEKTAERAFWLEILIRIFFEDSDATLRTKVIGLPVIIAGQGVRIFPGNFHPAYGIHNFFLRIGSHDFSLCFEKYDS